ncbi:MAG: hypothetical protein HC906_03990 [Bacteroidales bacterium]|nr:hypothetical protein [Bacteroidales bacterium]
MVFELVKNNNPVFSANDIFRSDTNSYANIQSIIDENELVTDSVISYLTGNLDSLKELPFDTVKANAEELKKSITRIEFPEGKDKLLFPFFRQLKQTRDSGKIVRIMHYGDSQIEGDRMTSYIRNKLQNKFGGYGPGLVPASQLYDFSYAIIQQSSPNWYRYTLYGQRDSTIKHKRYGALASFCRYEPENEKPQSDTSSHEAWISFASSPYSYANTKSFSRCRIFYGFNQEPF